MKAHVYASIALLVFLISACGESSSEERDAGSGIGPDASSIDPSDALFRPDHVLEVVITLEEADWQELRNQPDVIGLPKTTCDNQPSEKPYSYFPAEITIDGETTSNVGLRKKGGFGSITSVRPGLKVKTNKYDKSLRIAGLKRLTFNNNHQDSSRIRQCLGYDLFREAGLPAPRCSYAHVTVNGEDLGVYSHVESIKKPFLRRHFSDDSGNLYESGGRFTPNDVGGFQPKVNKEAPDCSDLDSLVDALQSDKASFVNAISSTLDLDSFVTYWAMEVIADHWDGYANNTNNFFFYHDPSSDKFHFIPWGIDALFEGRTRSTRPNSVYACGSLAWRLYDTPQTRDLFLNKQRELLDRVWQEERIGTEIDRMEALIAPFVLADHRVELANEIDQVRVFVMTRKSILMAEIGDLTPVWPLEQGQDSCQPVIGTISATFNTPWDTLDNFAAGGGSMSGAIVDVNIDSESALTSAGIDEENKAVIRILAEQDDGTFAVLFVFVSDPNDITEGTIAIDVIHALAFMSFYDPVTDTSYGGGLILNGSITLSQASLVSGEVLIGSITGEVVEL